VSAGKVYVGIPGNLATDPAIVMVNGTPLDPAPSLKLRNHSPTGFAWGYAGSGPAQLSLAILLDYLPSEATALELYQLFKWAVIARLKGDAPWVLTAEQIQHVLQCLLRDLQSTKTGSGAADER